MKRIIIKGRVQGVSFRVNIKRFAEKHGIRGYIRNLRNGDVEIITDEIIRLIQFCKSSPGFSRVDTISVSNYNTKEKFNDFSIR